MQETQVRSLGQEDPLEKEMATHSSILAWRIPWTEELGGLQSTGSQRVRQNLVTDNNTKQRPPTALAGQFLPSGEASREAERKMTYLTHKI